MPLPSMAALVHKLRKCRRRNATMATVASVSFLALVLVFSVFPGSSSSDHQSSSSSSLSQLLLLPPTRREDPQPSQQGSNTGTCQALPSLPSTAARCRFVSSHPPCAPQGYVDYLRLFYCVLGPRSPWLAGSALAAWLLVLFYLLGDTASEYFCAALEGLSLALRLPPSVAGVTLLSLGNGAPDVLSSVVAFAAGGGGEEGDAGDVGLSSVVGGALFVSTVVAGVVAIVAGRRSGVVIERRGFLRDVCFLLVAVGYLLAVLRTGAVTVWAAASFLSLYAAYVLLVWTSHCCDNKPDDEDDEKQMVVDEEEGCNYYCKPAVAAAVSDGDDDLAVPLLLNHQDNNDDAALPVVVVSSNKPKAKKKKSVIARRVLAALHAPLYLPRRLTIPDIAAHRWSKPYAVASAFLAPVLLAATTLSSSTLSTTTVLIPSSLLTGATLAAAASHSLPSSSPPSTRPARLPWLAGGFLMSVLWSYMVARELVALLVSIGLAAGVRPSVLGATVLAWGNSLGDLVSDVAMASTHHPGGGGAQTAVAGCYAGPAFNTVVGLGMSLTLAAAGRYPEPYEVPVDANVYQAVGFLVAGLVWAVVVLTSRGMRLDRVLGVGLIGVYLCFLCVRLGSLGIGSSSSASSSP